MIKTLEPGGIKVQDTRDHNIVQSRLRIPSRQKTLMLVVKMSLIL